MRLPVESADLAYVQPRRHTWHHCQDANERQCRVAQRYGIRHRIPSAQYAIVILTTQKDLQIHLCRSLRHYQLQPEKSSLSASAHTDSAPDRFRILLESLLAPNRPLLDLPTTGLPFSRGSSETLARTLPHSRSME